MSQQDQSPQNLLQFIGMILKAYITGIPSIIKGMILSIALSAVIANAVHFYLMGWVNDGWNYGNVPWLDAFIFRTGQETSPKVMLLYFMVTYLFWWLVGMLRSRGIKKTVTLIATTPIWIVKSLTSIGFAAFPMIMGGIAVSFVLGLTLLTNATAITLFLMMLTILISQDESLMVIGLQLGFKDVSGLVNRNQPQQMPSAHMPAVAIIGAGIGFGYMAFFNANTTVMMGVAALSIIGLVYMFIRNRKGQAPAIYATLLLMISAFALIAPIVLADDGGIPETGGWDNLPNNQWLINELIRRGYPASIASAIAASWISGLFSKPVLNRVEQLKDKYVQKDWSGITTGNRVDVADRWIEDPHGGWVTPDGKRWRKEQGGQGLSKTVIDAEDSPDLGDVVRVYTMEPPKDQGLIDGINDGIVGLDKFYRDKLHPDNWKNLTAGQKGMVMQQVADVLKKELGVDYELELYSKPDRPGLGGSYNSGTKKIKINTAGDAFSDPRTALRTIIHESRHAYQDKQANATGTDYQKMCNYNNSNYTTSTNDYVRYAEQFIERDSRTFGNNATNDLIDRLNKEWGW